MWIRHCPPPSALLVALACTATPQFADASHAFASRQVASGVTSRSDTSSLPALQLRFEAMRDSGRSYHFAHQRVSQPVMAYRFRVTMADSPATRAMQDAGPWQAVLRVHGRDAGAQLRFSRDEREVSLPRPLGVALHEGDSLTLEVHTEGRAASRIVLMVTVDYEPVDRRGGRLSVDPVSADLTSVGNMRSMSWEFSPESGGRVLAVCGAMLSHATSIELTSVTSGDVLWTLNVPVRARLGSAGVGGVVRLGVPVRAAETYRLTVVLDRSADAEPALLAATAMVLPHGREP